MNRFDHQAALVVSESSTNGHWETKPPARRRARRRIVVGRRFALAHQASLFLPIETPASQPIINGFDRTPLSEEERERGLRALAELREFHAKLLAERGGRPFSPPSWELINEARDERTRQLG